MGPERRDRRRQQPVARHRHEGRRTDQDRQDLRPRDRDQLQNAGLSAAHLQGAGAATRTSGGDGIGPNKVTYNDDIIEGWVGIGSQIDGLGHIGVGWTYYNGLKSTEFAAADGLKKLGVEKIPPIVTRGVLLDMAAYYNTDIVNEGTAFNVKEIDEVAKKQGVEIRQGDVVLFHTGWTSLIGKDDKRYNTGEPGVGVEGAKYLVSKGVVAVGSDTWAVEAIPFESKDVFPVHQIFLPMSGTYILENMNTDQLAADKGYEFLFVLGVPKITGAVQGIINPVAIR
jgi:kynurenine formamidase